MMGQIKMPPDPIVYDPPKAIGGEKAMADVVARAMLVESCGAYGDYCRVLDLLRWRGDSKEEVRFTYYFRKPNGTDRDWIYGQGAGHMTPETLVKLLQKAKASPDYGNFGKSLGAISV
jgi:hypothetical protein